MTGNTESIGDPLGTSLERLRALAAKNKGAPARRAAQISGKLRDSVIARVPAFTESANPEILPLLEKQLADLVSHLSRTLDGGPLVAPDFVAEFARQAAEHYFPLEALLHAYRNCLPVLLRETCAGLSAAPGADALQIRAAATEFLFEYIDAVCLLASENHVDRTRLLADVASDQRSELLSILLHGYDESDRRVSAILRDAGYLDRRLVFCVVLAQSTDPTEMHNPARARRLADYIDRLLAQMPGKRLVDIHRNKVTIVLSQMQRLSGWSTPRESLAQNVAREMLKVGTAARAGVSNDLRSTSQLPAAYRQASMAFDLSSVGERVVRFADIPLMQLMQRYAGDEFRRALPGWSQAFLDADDKARGQLSRTLRAYADENMNLLKTAKRLKIHANTVYARFDRIAALTGADARSFRHLGDLLIVADSRVHPPANRGARIRAGV